MPKDNNQQPTTNNNPVSITDDMPPVMIEDTLPPMAMDNQPPPVTNPQPQSSDSGSAAPSNDVVMPLVVTSGPNTGKPAKKFGSGKIIATILGLFLLIGGVGAGTYLVQQNQDIRERAGACSAKPCGPGMQCAGDNNGDGVGECVPSGTTDEQIDSGEVDPVDPPDNPWNDTDGDGTYKPSDGADPCGDGFRCAGDGWEFCIPATSTVGCRDAALEKGYTVFLGSATGDIYGSETWLCPKNHPVGTSCDGNNGGKKSNATKDSCFCGVLQIDTPSGFESYIGNCGCGGNQDETSSDNPTTPLITSATASCQNIKAYTPTWTLLTSAQLSQLKTGDSVNFCVVGSASSGSFDKAKFTINSVVQAETTTIRPTSTDFCQLYVIPTGVTTFNVTAQIHHLTLGWK